MYLFQHKIYKITHIQALIQSLKEEPTMQEKESIMVLRCELKIPVTPEICWPSLGICLVMPNSNPRDGVFNPHLTTIKDSYSLLQYFLALTATEWLRWWILGLTSIHTLLQYSIWEVIMLFDPRKSNLSRDMTKPTKWHVRPAKTQISLGIRSIWSESSLSAWRNLGSLATNWAHAEDSDQTGRMPRLIWVFAGRTLLLLVLSCRGSFILSYSCHNKIS